jgi:hypothetical protein
MLNDVTIEFYPSAFKHGISQADILWAFETERYDGAIDDAEENSGNKFLLIGFDKKANLLEVMYHIIDDNTIGVFHAMQCRKIYLPYLNQRSITWQG